MGRGDQLDLIIHAENNFLLLFAFGYNETSIVSLYWVFLLIFFVGQFPCGGGGDDFIFINKNMEIKLIIFAWFFNFLSKKEIFDVNLINKSKIYEKSLLWLLFSTVFQNNSILSNEPILINLRIRTYNFSNFPTLISHYFKFYWFYFKQFHPNSWPTLIKINQQIPPL